MLADYLQYLHNIFKTKFFHKIDYALEQKIESTMVKLYIKIRNKYFHLYENMPRQIIKIANPNVVIFSGIKSTMFAPIITPGIPKIRIIRETFELRFLSL